MANQPILPTPVPPSLNPVGGKPVCAPSVPGAPGKLPIPGPMMANKQGALPPGTKAPLPGQPNPGEEEEDEEGRALPFWEQPWVQNILPFMTSLSVHAGLIVIALVWAKSVWKPPAETNEEPPNTATSGVVKLEGGIKFQGPRDQDHNRAFAQDTDPTSTTNGFNDKKVTTELATNGGGAGDSTASNISVGAGSAFGKGKGLGVGNGGGVGSGNGGGVQAPFGPPGGGGIGPQGPVFGNGGRARRIAFVCDASGSMINKMPTLKDQLRKTVMALKPTQSFEMIFFQDTKYDSFSKYNHGTGLISATPENRRNADKFLEGVTTTGSTDPIPGIEAAFKTKPQLIYILTDGDFPDNDLVLKTCTTLNKDHAVKINTIAFIGDGDNEVAFKETLRKIATDSGGKFVEVKESELSN